MSTIELNDAMFGVAADTGLVHDAVVRQRAVARQVLAHTKDRSEVRGGGRKPWKQKGTGRARHGSNRSPIWIGGGVTFGPLKWQNFFIKMNKKARRKALFMSLSDKVANNAFVVLENLDLAEAKTRHLDQMIATLPVVGSRVLMVVDPANVAMRRAAQNLPNVETIAPNSLNTIDVLKAGTIVAGVAEVDAMTHHFIKQ